MFFKRKEAPIIISVGGSLMVPSEGIDTDFLSKLNQLIRFYVKKGKRFFLIAGGGNIARRYQEAGRATIGTMSEEDQDWLGIHCTHLNGHLLRTIFKDIAHPRVIQHYNRKLINWRQAIAIGAGWKPGWTTDYDAVLLAKDYGCSLVINLSNIDWVYDKDPKKFKDAQIIKKITWEEMEKIVGSKYKPGINVPFDPVATKLAKKLGLTVIITNGKDFDNLYKIIDNDVFKGTVITPFNIDASFYDREYYHGAKSGYLFGSRESFLGKFFKNLASFYKALLIKIFLNPKKCLDVGCGTGKLVRWLRFFGIEAYGVEISKDAIGLANKSVQSYLRQGDILNLPYEDDFFDAVVTYDVMEHIEKSKIKKALDETIRVSKKHILHKIYTTENLWINLFHTKDHSHISVMDRKDWQNIFSSIEGVSILRGSFLKLSSFFETIFLLRKK